MDPTARYTIQKSVNSFGNGATVAARPAVVAGIYDVIMKKEYRTVFCWLVDYVLQQHNIQEILICPLHSLCRYAERPPLQIALRHSCPNTGTAYAGTR